MNDETVTRILEMISAAGTARAKYIEAISQAKKNNFEKVAELVKEGGECFALAHKVHSEFLASSSANLAAWGKDGEVSLILVHAEDQMMCAETFRLVAEEFIDLYRDIKGKHE